MTFYVPKQDDFDKIRGEIKEGMQMRCASVCKCSCTACSSCRCTPCKHSLGANVITR